MTGKQYDYLHEMLFELMKWRDDLEPADNGTISYYWQRFQNFAFDIEVDEASRMISFCKPLYKECLSKHYPPWRYKGMRYLIY